MKGIVLLVGLLCAALPAYAEEIAIVDCYGASRSVVEIDRGETRSVTVAVDGIESPSLLRLESTRGDTAVAEALEEGTYVFRNVSAGNWKLCPQQNQSPLAFSIVDTSRVEQVAPVALAGVAGLALASFGVSEATSGSSSESRGGQGAGFGAEEELAAQSPEPALGFDDDDFEIGAPAAPLSPFS